MVDSVAPAGAGGFSGGGDIGSIGTSGSAAFDLGGIAPNGGGPEPIGSGDLGAAGLSPIGESGLTAFGPPGGDSQAAAADHYDALVQQNWDQLHAAAASNQALSESAASLGADVPAPSITPPTFTPPTFTTQPLDPFASPFAPTGLGVTLPPSALASPVISPVVDQPSMPGEDTTGLFANSLPNNLPSTPPAFDLNGPVTPPGADALTLPDAGLPADGPPLLAQAGVPTPDLAQTPAPDFSAPPPGDALVFRGSILPIGRTANGDIVPAWPGFLTGIGDAITYPGRVLNGEAQVIDPATGQPTDEAIANALTTAGLVAGGTGGFATREAGETVLGSGPVRVLRGAGPEGLNVTEGVAATGARAIDLGQTYEAGVRGLYGNNAFRARQYTALVDGEPVAGVADNVATIGGRNTAVEAKFVDDWANSLRNPASPNGARPWAVAEQQAMVDQARKYSAAFEGGAVYHTNSPELAAHYGQVFRDAGIENIRFVITPALRPGVL